jgi:copper chaperone
MMARFKVKANFKWSDPMIEFKIDAMSCGHCVKSITETVQTLDPKATLTTDLESKKVSINSQLDSAVLKAALTEAGYPPV